MSANRVDYSLLDEAGAGASMFYPRNEAYPPPAGASDHFVDIEAGTRLAMRFYPVDPAAPSLLFFHGNGEVASDYDDISTLYHESGLNLCVADFRGYGLSTGWPSLASLVGDAHPTAEAFARLLAERGFEGPRFIMGRSLGAHPAVELAAYAEGFGGLILESGAGNVRRSLERSGLLDTELGARLALAHEAKVRSIALPVLLIHGEQDELVPLRSAEDMRALLSGTTARLVTIPGAGHNDLLWVGSDRYFEAIREFVAAATT